MYEKPSPGSGSLHGPLNFSDPKYTKSIEAFVALSGIISFKFMENDDNINLLLYSILQGSNDDVKVQSMVMLQSTEDLISWAFMILIFILN